MSISCARRAARGAQTCEFGPPSQRIEAREVYRGAASCAQSARERAPPELPYGLWAVCDQLDGTQDGVLMRLLDARFDEIGGL
jgi:hypothetical protein